MGNKLEFKVYEAEDGWRWRLLAANNEIMASGEAYTTLAHADRAVATIIESVTSKVIDEGQFLILRREHWEEIKSRLTAMRIPELGDMIRLIEGAQL